MISDFNFKIIRQFRGYNSGRDKTNLDPRMAIRGSQNVYTWFKDGAVVAGEDADALNIATAELTDAGEYQCVVQSSLVPGLDIASDTFTVVVNIIEGIQEFSEGFRLNGNPVQHMLSIDADQMIKYVRISDITGKMVRNEEVHTGTIRMEVSDLSHGLYFVTLGTETGEEVLKIIKQ